MKGFSVAAVAAMVAVMLAASPALGAHALTPERFAALDAVYTAQIPIDRVPTSASALAAFRRTCEGLHRADALLGPLRTLCFDTVRIARATALFARCGSRSGCVREAVGLRRTIPKLIADARSANRAIDATVAEPACRLALRTPAKDLADARRLASALRLVERALKTGSRADYRRADKRLDALDDSGISAKQDRARFRNACG